MISDVLAEAVDTIRNFYLVDPLLEGVYEEPLRGEIESLCDLIADVSSRLDAPPGPEYFSPTEILP
jgi:hypothetical protein